MGHVSRPLIGVLVATVLVFALWLVALKPSSNGNGSSGGLGQYQSAINAAHNAVKVANGAAVAQGGNLATPSAAPAQSGTAPAAAGSATAATTAKPSNSSAQPPSAPAKAAVTHARATRLSIVDSALRRHLVIAMLFYNPAAADDRAVEQELATVPRHRGRVVKLAVPISEVSDFPVISNQLTVTQSPTLVLVDPSAQATTIIGFADTFEIAQRVDDALAVK
jgi:hypothetical protein